MLSNDGSGDKKPTSIALPDGTKEVLTMCNNCTKALITHPPKAWAKRILIYNPFKKRYVIPAKYFTAPEIRKERCHGCGSYWREIEESGMDDSNLS
jgi:hypothetical protein